MKVNQPEGLIPHHVRIVYERPLYSGMYRIRNSRDVKSLIMESFPECVLDYKEHGWALFLTTSNRVLGATLLSVGTQDSLLVPVKQLVQHALLCHARSVILVHNHPSGNLAFSDPDVLTTKKALDALMLVDINLDDHIVITSESYASMADDGILDRLRKE